jgi:hypothetical protein
MAFSPWQLATMRSIFSSAAATLALASLLAPCAPAAGATSPIDAGRSAGRGLLLFRDPRGCAIALMHDRCVADVEAFLAGKSDADFRSIPKIGPHPAAGLRAFVAAGDRDGFDTALGWINSRSSTSEMWAADPRGAALFDAGIEDVTLPAARGNPAFEIMGSSAVLDLATHVAQIPPGTFPVDTAPLRSAPKASKSPVAGATDIPPGTLTFAHALVTAVDAADPPSRLAPLGYAEGAPGFAALGVAGATVAELVDSPEWLAQADAQAFVDDYTARLAYLVPDHGSQILVLRAALRGDKAFAHDAALAESTSAMSAAMDNNLSQRPAIVLGLAAAQMTYNAAVYRDERLSSNVLHVLETGTALDGVIPGWKAERSMRQIPSNDWAAQYQLGLRLVGLILRANPA